MTDLTTHQPGSVVSPLEAVNQIKQRLSIVRAVRSEVMQDEVHFGKIPGTDKPTLLQPGAQVLCMAFGLTVHSESSNTRYLDNGHIDVEYVVSLTHAASGVVWASGIGSASTLESKHRYRMAKRSCPECGKETILKSKHPDRQTGDLGFYCYAKIGGCGANFHSTDESITGQEVGRTENPDIADQYNTVRKMAWKRAFIAAVLTATCASEMFTQDIGDDDSGNTDPASHSPKVDRLSQARSAWAKTITDPERLKMLEIVSTVWEQNPQNHEWLKEAWKSEFPGMAMPKWPEASYEALEFMIEQLTVGRVTPDDLPFKSTPVEPDDDEEMDGADDDDGSVAEYMADVAAGNGDLFDDGRSDDDDY